MLLCTVFTSWDHVLVNPLILQDYWLSRMAVFIGNGAVGALVFQGLKSKGAPAGFSHPWAHSAGAHVETVASTPSHGSSCLSKGVWAALIGAFVFFQVLRFPLLVFTGVVELDCARPVATGPEYFTWVLGAPLAEEVTYRALPLSFALSLGHRGWTLAILLATSAIFALSHTHMDLDGMINVATLGLFCGLIFLKTQKLWHIVLVHSLANTLVMLGEWSWHELGYPWCS